jgi:hypothetical protein
MQRSLAWSILAALLVCVSSLVLFAPDYFEDNRYNLGVARRSALPGAQHLLETSLNHLYFEALPTVRAEDWHRGLSVLLLSFWARRFADSEAWMRVPHLLWVAAWLTVQALLLRLAAPKASLGWMLIGCLSFLLAFEGRTIALRRAFLDDVPATVFALAGVYFFARAGVTRRSAALLGTLWGMAAFCKDALLLTGPIGVALLAFGQRSGARRAEPGSFPAAAGLFCAAFALTLLPRFLWSFVDHGRFLQNPAPHWIVAHYFGRAYPSPEHFPYFLTGDTRYLSRVEMAGGPWRALSLLVHGPMRETFFVVLSLAAVWSGLAVTWLLSRRAGIPWRPVHARILGAFAVWLGFFALFFGLGFGEARQIRYWLVPITLAGVLIVARLAETLPALGVPRGRRTIAWLLVSAVLLLIVNAGTVRKVLERGLIVTPDPPVTEAMSRAVSERVASSGSVIMEVRPGIFYWSNHPEDRVVAFPLGLFRKIGPEQTRRFLDQFEARFVVCDADGPGRRILEDLGFSESLRSNNEVLLEDHSDRAEPSAARR